MNHTFGPWTTQIDAGESPRLSAFWRRRMTRLPGLPRGNPRMPWSAALALMLAAAAMAAVPTLQGRVVSAEREGQAAAQATPTGTTDRGPGEAARRQPAAAGAISATSGRLSFAYSAVAGSDDVIVLPGHRLRLLMQTPVLKDLQVTAQQRQRLLAIQAKYYADQSKFLEDTAQRKLAQNESGAALTRWQRERTKEVQRQVKEILTPQQVQSLEELTFHDGAANRLFDPGQESDLNRLTDGHRAKMQQFHRELGEKMLKLLTPAQQGKLRAEVEEATKRIEGIGADQPPDKPAAKLAPPKEKDGAGSADQASLVPAAVSAAPVAPVDVLAPEDVLALPAYGSYINSPRIRKELKLTADQQRRLREISAAHIARREKLARDWAAVPPKEQQAKEAEHRRMWDQNTQVGRKQVEAVLTPQQVETYQKIMFPGMAESLLYSPEVLKTIGFTAQQEQRLGELHRETRRRLDEQSRRQTDQSLAVLSGPQREKLRAEIDRSERGSEVSSEWTTRTSTPTQADTLTVDIDRTRAIVLPAYGDLADPVVRKQLALSADQEKQLREITANYLRESEKIGREASKLSPDELQRMYRDFQQKSAQTARQRIEGLLTPQQLAALKEIVFRRAAVAALTTPRVQGKIGLGQREKDALGRIWQAARESSERISREASQQCLGLLTPGQEKKLREEIDRLGW